MKKSSNTNNAKQFYQDYIDACRIEDHQRFLGSFLPHRKDSVHEAFAHFICNIADSYVTLYPKTDTCIDNKRDVVQKEAVYFVMRELINLEQTNSQLFRSCVNVLGRDCEKEWIEVIKRYQFKELPAHINNVSRYNQNKEFEPICLHPTLNNQLLLNQIGECIVVDLPSRCLKVGT